MATAEQDHIIVFVTDNITLPFIPQKDSLNKAGTQEYLQNSRFLNNQSSSTIRRICLLATCYMTAQMDA